MEHEALPRCLTAIRKASGARVIVRLTPSNMEISITSGECLMRAAISAGLKWATFCGGHAQCGYCMVEVTGGELSPPGPAERTIIACGLKKPRHGGQMRLACQIYPQEDLVVADPPIR